MQELLQNKISCIYGAAATGKTTLCLTTAINEIKKGKKVLFLDPQNSFSVERFKQLANEKLLDFILLLKIKNFKDQQLKIKKLDKIIEKSNISLIIIDTLCFHYSRLRRRKPELANAMLKSQLRILKEISNKIPVLITNQVYTNLRKNEIEPIAFHIVKDYCNLIELKNKPRKIIFKKEKKELLFDIEGDKVTLK